MSKHAPAECPRCSRLFECKVNAPHRCDCVKIALTPDEILFIRTNMLDEEDCLCAICLDDLRHLCAVKNNVYQSKYSMKNILETPRLWLREYTPEDAADVLRLNSDTEIMRFANEKPTESLDEALAQIAVFQKQYAENGYGRWAVILKETGEHVGYCGLKYRNAEADPRRDFTDIGYRFERKHWKSGFATEAARACLEFGFENLHLQRLVGCAPVENKQSIRVLERIGLKFYSNFLLEGTPSVWYQLWRDDYFNNATLRSRSE